MLFIASCLPKFPGLVAVPPPKGREGRGSEPPSSLLPPPSPVFALLLSCSFGSDKLNLDCVKGELSLAGDSVCCYF